MRKGRLEDWQEIGFFGHTRLFGKVYGCDAFEEGEEMITSELIKYHSINGALVAETASGSMYHLGEANPKPETLKEIMERQLAPDNSLN